MYLLLLTIVSLANHACPNTIHENGSHLSNSEFSDIHHKRMTNIIEHVNSKEDSTWIAGHNFDDYSDLVHLLGSLEHSDKTPKPKVIKNHLCPHHQHLPKTTGSTRISPGADCHNLTISFDGRKAWSRCKSVGKIYNQGRCASDWVIAPVSAINDRLCINNVSNTQLSPHEPLSCCKKCGWGCQKGYPRLVYERFLQKGLPTGGDYKSNEGCQPYEIAPCANFKACAKKKISTPECKPYCYNGEYKKNSYEKDLIKGFKVYTLGCPCCAGYNLREYGPLTSTMEVYEDFLTYKSGIYKHLTGRRLGSLTVRIIGYNDEPSYWLAANSWGKKWGENGFFKIERGQMQCGIDTTQGMYVRNPKGDK